MQQLERSFRKHSSDMDSSLAIVLMLFVTITITNSTIVLEEGGYSNILVAISEDIPQPEGDGASVMIESIKVQYTVEEDLTAK